MLNRKQFFVTSEWKHGSKYISRVQFHKEIGNLIMKIKKYNFLPLDKVHTNHVCSDDSTSKWFWRSNTSTMPSNYTAWKFKKCYSQNIRNWLNLYRQLEHFTLSKMLEKPTSIEVH